MKAKLKRILAMAQSNPTFVIIGFLAIYLGYGVLQNWQTRWELDRQSKRIDQYAKQSQQALDETNKYLASFEKNHESTLNLLGIIREMSGNIDRLAERDREITIRVNGLETNYEIARKGSTNSGTNNDLPLRVREERVLAADRELYPTK